MKRSLLRSWSVVAIPLVGASIVAACQVTPDEPWAYDDGSTTGNPPSDDGLPQDDDGCLIGCNEQTVLSTVVPAPLSGGTLVVLEDGVTAVVSDPDRDRVVVADLPTRAAVVEYATPARAEPGRLVEDRQGVVHVALRQAGQIMSLSPKAIGTASFADVCAAPRGLAASPDADVLYVACASGELLALDTANGMTTLASARLAPDLRDAVLSGGKLFVSHMRSAEVDVVDAASLALTKTVRPLDYVSAVAETPDKPPRTYAPSVGWRMVARPEGGVLLLHQHAATSAIVVEGGGYEAGDCNRSIVHAAVMTLDGEGTILDTERSGTLSGLPVPVDLAVSRAGDRVAVIGAGASIVSEITRETLIEADGCNKNFPLAMGGSSGIPVLDGGAFTPEGRLDPTAQEPVAVAYDGEDNLIVQTREPAALEIHSLLSGNVIGRVELGGESRFDTGYLMFNGDADLTQRPVACASCHPEGREDGHTWIFEGFGARRTQSLAGGISGTEPLHWDGTLANVDAIMKEVFVGRMGGAPQSPARVAAVTRYIDAFPAAPHVPSPDPLAAARGQELFESAAVGCADCHAGERLTNNDTVDVGTGLLVQVPSLRGVAARAPFMHDGCAPTLTDRFGAACGGGDEHGTTSQLDASQIADLVAYLETL